MNSQFSYELDERQIRIQLQNAELDYNDSLWAQFANNLVVQPMGMPAKAAMKVNLGLSRRVLVPAFFVVVICGLSALLFSFVDFRKSENKAEKAAVPASTGKEEIVPEKKTEPVVKPQEKLASTPVNTTPENKPMASPANPVVATPAVVQPQAQVQTQTAAVKAKPELTEEQKAWLRNAYYQKMKKKKEQEALMEHMPSINASSAISADNNQQPEPEIKLD